MESTLQHIFALFDRRAIAETCKKISEIFITDYLSTHDPVKAVKRFQDFKRSMQVI